MTVAGLLLAAGGGSRFGGPKALVRFGGELLVERGARVLAEAGCDPVVVVVGAGAEEVRRTADLSARIVDNPDWAEGIGSSLRAGLDALAGAADAAVVALADQPHVAPALIDRLVEAWRTGAVAAVATYDGAPRNPVLLDASTWREVAATAQGDAGARVWLRRHPDRVVLVPCEDLGAESDIDTPADLARLAGERDGAG